MKRATKLELDESSGPAMNRKKLVALAVAAVIVLLAGGGLLYLATIDLNRYRPDITAEVEGATRRRLVISGPITGSVLSFSPTLVAKNVTFDNAPWGDPRPMMRARRVEISVALWPLLTGTLKVKRVVAVGADIFLETSKDGVGNWEFGNADGRRVRPKATAAASGSPALPVVEDVRLVASTVTYRSGVAGEITKIGFNRLSAWTNGAVNRVDLDIDGIYDGVAIKTTGHVGSVAALLRRDRSYPLNLKLAYGDSDLDTKLSVDLGAKVIRITGSLTVATLNVDRLLGGSTAGNPSKTAKRRLFGSQPLPWRLLRSVDADVSFTAGALLLGRQRVTNAKVKVSLKNGELRMSPFTATLAGGTLKADFAVDGSGSKPVTSLKIDGRNLAMKEVTELWFEKATMASRLSLTADLTGGGESLRAIAESLRGRVVVLMGRGPIHSNFFKLLSTDLLASIKPWAKSGEPLELTCAIARFDFMRGLGRSRVLVLDTTRASLIGAGTINMRTETTDLLLAPSTKQASVASVGALVPIRVRGPLDRPRVHGDPSGVAREAAKSLWNVAKVPVNLLGTVLGTKTGTRSGSPCGWARAKAREERPATPVAPNKTDVPGPKTDGKPADKKKGGFLKRLNPFD